MKVFPIPIAFEWDKGNIDKNFKKHGTKNEEAEQVFVNNPIVLFDEKHSEAEKRYLVLGETNTGKLLSVIYTKRGNKIRIISARLMNRRERNLYEEKKS